MAIGSEEIHRRIDHHTPTEMRVAMIGSIRDAIGATAIAIDDLAPDCREKSLAITKLEEVTYWAVAAIVRPPAAKRSEG